MTGIDDISIKIGQLTADAANSRRQREQMADKLDKLSDRVSEMASKIDLLVTSTTAVNESMTKANDRISALERLKSRIIGVVVGVSAVIGSAVSYIAKYVHGLGS